MDFENILDEAVECEELSTKPHFTELDISIPGGDSETPKRKPSDLRGMNIPGGDSEYPTHKPKDLTPIPNGNTQMGAGIWNDALDALKKTFKEGAEIAEQLKMMRYGDTYTEGVDCDVDLDLDI